MFSICQRPVEIAKERDTSIKKDETDGTSKNADDARTKSSRISNRRANLKRIFELEQIEIENILRSMGYAYIPMHP